MPELNETLYMAKQCEITGKKTQIGGRYSNRTRATQFNPCGKTKRSPNLQKKRIFVPELDKHVSVNVSAKSAADHRQKRCVQNTEGRKTYLVFKRIQNGRK